jgi:uncharacterized protein (TIGR03435 family)
MASHSKAIVLVAGLLSIQANSQEQVFEVASVRPSLSGPVKVDADPIRLTVKAQAVDTLIRLAFGLREYQYQGPHLAAHGALRYRRHYVHAPNPAGTTRDAPQPADR